MLLKFIIFLTVITLTLGHANETTLQTLEELYQSKTMLQEELKSKNEIFKKIPSEDEKHQLKEEIKKLNNEVSNIETKFEKIATGIDTSVIKQENKDDSTTLSEDFQLLLKPLVDSAKEATKEMREKAKLQEEIDYYKVTLPHAVQAYDNIDNLLKLSKDKKIKQELEPLKKYWAGQVKLLSSNLNASLHQVDILEKNSVSFTSSLKQNTKKFFQERGLFLLEGFLAFIFVLALMNFIYLFSIKLFPIFTKPSRSFYLRLLDLLYRFVTVILAIVIPMAIFYIEEDWFLFSIGILLFVGLLWTFRNLISKLWQQARLFLNIGSVREDERIFYEGLPWKVKSINIFTLIENPISGVSLRIPIESLVGLTSRPSHEHEPWFPAKIDDWVILSDGYYGKVVGISLEFIELEDLGGGHKNYLVSEFLALSPLNLSTDFRVVETFGISYRHQKESTTKIIEQLEAFILQKIEEEDYGHGLKKLLVQFSAAGDSSLNMVIIANFNGEMAPLYYRLRRAIQRWCVDACNHYNWEIPFPQLTIHQPN
ncbi:hypothetical protein KKC13_00435 [bacterium]|nr:hypothetical protein [bacterium]MBU1957224.1 hypothetical protein [bacterium]